MVEVEVYPPEAAAAGCKASCSVTRHHEEVTEFTQRIYDFYQLNASEANGWRFVKFEWTYQGVNVNTGAVISSYDFENDWDKTYPPDGVEDDYLRRYESIDTHPLVNAHNVYDVVNCRAVFEQYGDITVTTAADPVAGGTTSPVSETHHHVGSPSTTFTLTATPNAGYVFEKWLHNGAVKSLTAQTTVTLYFSSSAQTKHYVAKFRISDKILHGANGSIIHGSGGSILRGG